jgi:hypothetical protein
VPMLLAFGRRCVTVLDARRGRVAATVRLDADGAADDVSRRRRLLGRGPGGSPTGQAVERGGVVWFVVKGGESAAIGIDVELLLRAEWRVDVVATIAIVIVATGLLAADELRRAGAGATERRGACRRPSVQPSRTAGNLARGAVSRRRAFRRNDL